MLIDDIRAAKRLHAHHDKVDAYTFIFTYVQMHIHTCTVFHTCTHNTQRAFDSNVELACARMDEHLAERAWGKLTRVLASLSLALKATEVIRAPVS